MSKRTARKPQTETPATRDAAAPVPTPEAPTASLPRPRARKKAAAPVDVAAADGRSAPAETAAPGPSLPTHDEIATRAYYIALERGFSSDPMADWLLAERELTGVSVSH